MSQVEWEYDQFMEMLEEIDAQRKELTALRAERDEYKKSTEIWCEKYAPELKALRAIVDAAPKGCICHVAADDGYTGTSHPDWCIKYTNALDALRSLTSSAGEGEK